MSMKNINVLLVSTAFFAVVVWSSCGTAGGNDPGKEYMPDMFHSTAYEANVYDYYFYNTWGSEEDYKKYAMPRKPVKGTIPRSYLGFDQAKDAETKAYYQSMPINGSVPYYYQDTEEERTRAMAEIVANPYPITASGLERGRELYVIYCGICHGEKADGAGYLVREDGGVYPAQPANFLLPDFVSASEGRYYHSIMYGKNVMGGYSDKLSYEERWQVIHFIRSLRLDRPARERRPTCCSSECRGRPAASG
jgi:mono/diheme cytochrome c family protein